VPLEVLAEGARQRAEDAVARVERHAPLALRALEGVRSEESPERVLARVRRERHDGSRRELRCGEEARRSAEAVSDEEEGLRAAERARDRHEVVAIQGERRVLEAPLALAAPDRVVAAGPEARLGEVARQVPHRRDVARAREA